MHSSEAVVLESELRDRRDRLQSLRPRLPESVEIVTLLREVDDALHRLGQGTYGLCEECHDPIEKDRLRADPLVRFCLDHLTGQQRLALEQDMEAARQVQIALLPPPRAYPGWEIHYAYQPTGVVSGDYCDVVARDAAGDSLLVLLGDVSGKGVSASLLMSHLHAMFRSLSTQGTEISQMVERANRLLCESMQQSRYATLVCVQTAANGEAAVCNAGHCPPVVFGASGASLIDSTGLPLGMFCEGNFPCTNLRLDKGDTLLLYSDGLVESENSRGEEYGVDRLQSSLEDARRLPSAEAVVQQSLHGLQSFLDGARPADDITLMAIRRM